MTRRVEGFGQRLDRSRPIGFTFDGVAYQGFVGDTLASALLANGVTTLGHSVGLGRPRGIVAAGAEDPCSLVDIEAPYAEPMRLATTIELVDGLVARGLPGQGRLSPEPDRARYDSVHLHVDVAVVGAGPSGLVAALVAARAGLRVALVDERPAPGGSLVPVPAWVEEARAELAASTDVTHLQLTTAFALYDDNLVLALERRTDHLDSSPENAARTRIWRIRADEIVVATGAHERTIALADNDRPGVLLARSAYEFLHRYGVLVGRRIVLLTTNDAAALLVPDLEAAGAETVAVVDVREGVGVAGVLGDAHVSGVVLSDGRRLECDTLLVSGGWNPAVHLFSQAGGKLRYDDGLGAFVPAGPVAGLTVVGSASGVLDEGTVLRQSRVRAEEVVGRLGASPATEVGRSGRRSRRSIDPGAVCWSIRPEGADPTSLTTHFVDLQRDATIADIARAVGAGMSSVEHVKRYTTIGTAHDQGKTSGVLASGIVSELTGLPMGQLGTTTHRPPYAPVPFAALAGRDRGDLYEPVRVTAVHDWHVAHGAEFEPVGQWLRPRHYPLEGESMDGAVRRETAAVRTGVGILDGSTLGTIDVQGPDAGVFLDLIYTNLISSLKPGMVRYGVMCGVDGMVIDDGTVMRLEADRFIVFTTTGGAAKILDWMEEWLQTEWPQLRVRLCSLTDHWATFPVVGPRSRSLIGSVFADVDVSNEAFPFMAVRETSLGGVPVRLARVSFSGELAYEVNVDSRYALDLWQILINAGQPYGLTPYGTETMHVLRAEKGYPIIGQDTDGTVTPHDLALSWAVSKKKIDFIGKRSLARPITTAPGRRQLVGLLPADRSSVLTEGSQLVAVGAADLDAARERGPVAMLGFVTSSYESVALERPFALALLDDGFERIGSTLTAVHNGVGVPVQVTSHVLYDPEGARRDG